MIGKQIVYFITIELCTEPTNLPHNHPPYPMNCVISPAQPALLCEIRERGN